MFEDAPPDLPDRPWLDEDPPCTGGTFDPPAFFECRDKVRENPADCNPPCVRPRVCDLRSPSVLGATERARESYKLQTRGDISWDADAETLVAQAFAILGLNVDVIRWISCIYYGQYGALSPASCIERKIRGTGSFRLNLVLVGEEGSFRASPSYAPVPFGSPAYPGGRIEIFDGSRWGKYLAAYRTSAGAPQFCIVLDLAATILHELVHVCTPLQFSDSGDESEDCDPTYLLENAFRWAMAQRYPCISGTSCGFFDDPGMWGNDGLTYFDRVPDEGVVAFTSPQRRITR